MERLLIGCNDGHVMTLVDAEQDDASGADITGYAKTAPQAMAGDLLTTITGLMVTASNPYATEDDQVFNVELFIGKRPTAHQSGRMNFDQGQENFTTVGGLTPVFGASTFFAGKELLTKRLNVKVGARGHLFQVKVSATGRWTLREISAEFMPKGRR